MHPDLSALSRDLPRLRGADGRIFFTGGSRVFLARAPGRLDLMGGIADYSGSLVMEMPIAEAAVAAAARGGDRVTVRTEGEGEPGLSPEASFPLGELVPGPAPDFEAVRKRLGTDPSVRWAAYVAGCFPVLAREKGARFSEGARIWIRSNVPPGKGVSSSAAVEVASMKAVAGAYSIPLGGAESARLCQIVENRIAGAPCGLMDQLTSALGEEGRILPILCQPDLCQEPVPIPDGVQFIGIDSGIRHAVGGASYGDVRVGAFMGYRIIADFAGARVEKGERPGLVRIPEPPYGGYLANLGPSEFEGRFRAALPERMTGRDFLDRYGGTTDPVTAVDPARTYAVRVPARHPVHENVRTALFRRLLSLVEGPGAEEVLAQIGELMFQSHESYSACGLGSEGTDEIVAEVRRRGPGRGLFGAKITGGGSGGTVVVLARGSGGVESALEIAEEYGRRRGFAPKVFRGSSPGAERAGVLSRIFHERSS